MNVGSNPNNAYASYDIFLSKFRLEFIAALENIQIRTEDIRFWTEGKLRMLFIMCLQSLLSDYYFLFLSFFFFSSFFNWQASESARGIDDKMIDQFHHIGLLIQQVNIGICHSALDPYRLLLLISQILHLLVITVSTAEALRYPQRIKLLQLICYEVLLSTIWVRRIKHVVQGEKSMTVFEQLNPAGPCMLIDY